MNRRECIQKINRLIPCPEVQNSIFRGDEKDEDFFLTTRNSISVYFSNILNIAFMFIYARYKKWKDIDNQLNSSTSNNFIRVFQELDKIYTDTSLSFDIIENLLMDIQLDIAINGQISSELRLTNKIIKNDNFSRYAYIAKKARKSSRINDTTPLVQRYDELIDLISTFPFLRDLSYTLRPIDHAFLCDENHTSVSDLYDIVLHYDNGFLTNEAEFNENLETDCLMICRNEQYYFLERIEQNNSDQNNPYLILTYWIIGNFNAEFNLYICSNDKTIPHLNNSICICEETALDTFAQRFLLTDSFLYDDNDDEFRIKNFYNINYKYIKNLALSISDVLQENSKKMICKQYGRKHQFKESNEGVILTSNDKDVSYTWSEIISVLMINEGATSILSYLLRGDKEIRTRLLSNLEFRFGKSSFSKEEVETSIKEAFNKFDEQFMSSNHVLDRNKHAYSRELNDHHAEIEARKIIFAVSKAVNGNRIKEHKLSFPISIRSKMQLLEEIRDSDLDLDTKIKTAKQIVVQTFKTLYFFYYGFFGYASKKKNFDNESFYRPLTADEIKRFQKQANKEFSKRIDEIRLQLNEIEDDDVITILSSFKDFCLRCERNQGDEYQQYLKDMLGKNKIMDTSMIDFLIASFSYPIDDDTFSELVDDVKRVFTYLKTGKTRNSSLSLGVIFPYVSTCEYTDISRDGNEIYHFTIISRKGAEKDLRVLSEFSYTLNKKYYFLPNKLSSDERLNLWIEPIIIGYESFDNEASGDEDDEA